jgi:uncharacterized secreted protein with C-terminal beta-propeller domain
LHLLLETAQYIEVEELEKFSNLFKSTCDQILNNLGQKPFHIWSGLNVAVFDSVFTTLAKFGFKVDVANRFELLKKDESFVTGVRGATSDESIVELRMLLAKQYLVD